MALFDNFYNTIFIKENSEIDNQIKTLYKIQEKLNRKSMIKKDLKSLERGKRGEKNIHYELKTMSVGMYVLQDIKLQWKDLVAQIDFVVITKCYIYLIESKYFTADVKVNESGEFIVDYKNSKAVASPYNQAHIHKDIVLKKMYEQLTDVEIARDINELNNILKPLVVFANESKILDVSDASEKIKKSTIKWDQLREYIENDIDNYSGVDFMTIDTMKKIADFFLESNLEDRSEYFVEYKRILIEQNLKKMREERSAKLGFNGNYIFTNKELEKILNLMPKTYSELQKSGVLASIRCKKHGKEIIKVINESTF